MIFDEATSALDKKNEAEVQKSIDMMKKDLGQVTTVVIAHRLSTVRNADTIIVLKKGKIVEVGNHDTLLRQHPNGTYAKLVADQEKVDANAENANAEAEAKPAAIEADDNKLVLPPITFPTEEAGALESARQLVGDKIGDADNLKGKDLQTLETDGAKPAAKKELGEDDEKEITRRANEKLEEQNKLEADQLKHVSEPKKGMGYAVKKMKEYQRPLWAIILAYISSLAIGSCGPMSGFLIVKCLWGVTEAQYVKEFGLEGESSGLKNITVWLIIFGSLAFVGFFGKTG